MEFKNLQTNWATGPNLDEIVEHIKKGGILVWGKAYYFLLNKKNGYSWIVAFKDQDRTLNAMKRLMYRYDNLIVYDSSASKCYSNYGYLSFIYNINSYALIDTSNVSFCTRVQSNEK